MFLSVSYFRLFCPSLTSGLRWESYTAMYQTDGNKGAPWSFVAWCLLIDESIHTHLVSLALLSSSRHAQVASHPSHCRHREFVINRGQQKVYEAAFDPDEAVRETACLVERSGPH